MKKLISLIVVFFLSVFGVAATAEPSLAPEKLVMDVSTQVLERPGFGSSRPGAC